MDFLPRETNVENCNSSRITILNYLLKKKFHVGCVLCLNIVVLIISEIKSDSIIRLVIIHVLTLILTRMAVNEIANRYSFNHKRQIDCDGLKVPIVVDINFPNNLVFACSLFSSLIFQGLASSYYNDITYYRLPPLAW